MIDLPLTSLTQAGLDQVFAAKGAQKIANELLLASAENDMSAIGGLIDLIERSPAKGTLPA